MCAQSAVSVHEKRQNSLRAKSVKIFDNDDICHKVLTPLFESIRPPVITSWIMYNRCFLIVDDLLSGLHGGFSRTWEIVVWIKVSIVSEEYHYCTS